MTSHLNAHANCMSRLSHIDSGRLPAPDRRLCIGSLLAPICQPAYTYKPTKHRQTHRLCKCTDPPLMTCNLCRRMGPCRLLSAHVIEFPTYSPTAKTKNRPESTPLSVKQSKLWVSPSLSLYAQLLDLLDFLAFGVIRLVDAHTALCSGPSKNRTAAPAKARKIKDSGPVPGSLLFLLSPFSTFALFPFDLIKKTRTDGTSLAKATC